MSLLDSIIIGGSSGPPKIVLYGQAGVGKTTFAAEADALLIDCENGVCKLVEHFPGLKRTPYLDSWPVIRNWLADLASRPADWPVAIDTIDWMIRRIIEHVTIDLDPKSMGSVTNTIGSAHGGYFKARDIVQNIVYRELLPMLNAIANNGSPIILLAHAENTTLTTPEGFNVRMAAPDLPDWILPVFVEWADAVLYASFDADSRLVVTRQTNTVLAKNRYGLPPTLPLSWPALMQATYPAAPSNGEATHG